MYSSLSSRRGAYGETSTNLERRSTTRRPLGRSGSRRTANPIKLQPRRNSKKHYRILGLPENQNPENLAKLNKKFAINIPTEADYCAIPHNTFTGTLIQPFLEPVVNQPKSTKKVQQIPTKKQHSLFQSPNFKNSDASRIIQKLTNISSLTVARLGQPEIPGVFFCLPCFSCLNLWPRKTARFSVLDTFERKLFRAETRRTCYWCVLLCQDKNEISISSNDFPLAKFKFKGLPCE